MNKRKMSLTFTGALILMFVLSGCQVFTANFSQNDGKGSQYVNGKVKGRMSFKTSETEDAIKWMESSKKTGEDWMQSEIDKTSDPEKLKQLKESLAESKKRNAKDMFTIEKDGSSYIETNMPFLKLVMDGTITTTTDKDGFYSFENLSIGKHKIEIYYNDKFIRAEEIDIKSKNINNKKESNPKKDLNIIIDGNLNNM